ncbi:MAG: type II toxin-antitoxin system RelB/DinJ family antitoxin [Candidatus Aminicenantes bacterium]|nr:type II toxin-antitoxin system RelB/DinJ family antitoxin [Candidatus Aminicenantes bacterium]
MADSIVRSRIDPVVKDEANRILKSMGLTLSEGIRLFLHQVIVDKALPFMVKLPNKTTREAMTAARNGKDLEQVSLAELADEWDAE